MDAVFRYIKMFYQSLGVVKLATILFFKALAMYHKLIKSNQPFQTWKILLRNNKESRKRSNQKYKPWT